LRRNGRGQVYSAKYASWLPGQVIEVLGDGTKAKVEYANREAAAGSPTRLPSSRPDVVFDR
jgi:hypothetical protein